MRIGGGLHERSELRAVQRNCRRPQALPTTAGDPEVVNPKPRAGSILPCVRERHRRSAKAVFAVVMEAGHISGEMVAAVIRTISAPCGLATWATTDGNEAPDHRDVVGPVPTGAHVASPRGQVRPVRPAFPTPPTAAGYLAHGGLRPHPRGRGSTCAGTVPRRSWSLPNRDQRKLLTISR